MSSLAAGTRLGLELVDEIGDIEEAVRAAKRVEPGPAKPDAPDLFL
jgi:hypothetical protein